MNFIPLSARCCHSDEESRNEEHKHNYTHTQGRQRLAEFIVAHIVVVVVDAMKNRSIAVFTRSILLYSLLL